TGHVADGRSLLAVLCPVPERIPIVSRQPVRGRGDEAEPFGDPLGDLADERISPVNDPPLPVEDDPALPLQAVARLARGRLAEPLGVPDVRRAVAVGKQRTVVLDVDGRGLCHDAVFSINSMTARRAASRSPAKRNTAQARKAVYPCGSPVAVASNNVLVLYVN